VLAPTAIYLLLNMGRRDRLVGADGDDIAFVLVSSRCSATGFRRACASSSRLCGSGRCPVGAHARDLLSRDFHIDWLIASAAGIAALYVLNLARCMRAGLSGCHLRVVGCAAFGRRPWHARGIFLAAFLPTRPAPKPSFLLAQAATALSALDHAEAEAEKSGDEKTRNIELEPVWDWALRNLSAASDRLMSPAERVERAVAPWSTYLILPLFSFSATGIALSFDFSSPDALHVFWA